MNAVIRVAGVGAEMVGRDLQTRLMPTAEASFEMERDVDPVALVGLALAGVQTVKTVWDWWVSARDKRVSVTLVLDNGRVVELEGLERSDLETMLKAES